jgi:hypothetical protein
MSRGAVTAAPATPGATSPTAAATPASSPAARTRGRIDSLRRPDDAPARGTRSGRARRRAVPGVVVMGRTALSSLNAVAGGAACTGRRGSGLASGPPRLDVLGRRWWPARRPGRNGTLVRNRQGRSGDRPLPELALSLVRAGLFAGASPASLGRGALAGALPLVLRVAHGIGLARGARASAGAGYHGWLRRPARVFIAPPFRR